MSDGRQVMTTCLLLLSAMPAAAQHVHDAPASPAHSVPTADVGLSL